MDKIKLPVNVAPPPAVYIPGQGLSQVAFCHKIIACMLLKLGVDDITFDQDDFNATTGLILLEGGDATGCRVGLGFPAAKQS